MKTLVLILAIIPLLILFLKKWNNFSRTYNNNIIARSNCNNCSEPLGHQCIADAVKIWEIEKLKIMKEKKGIILRNLNFTCEKCGAINSEQEIYKKYRRKNN